MSCAHLLTEDAESCFTMDVSRITFGRGALLEVGALARERDCKRVAVFTDARVARIAALEDVRRSLASANIDAVVYDAVEVEPTDKSLLEAARFAKEGRFDGYVSVGGGSVIDTCKVAVLLASYPADLIAYVNKPVGRAELVPGPLPFHVACPTTSGTGAECTGIAVFDLLALQTKTAIASARLRPAAALVDPQATMTLPSEVVAASGFDVLCHALESFTARAFNTRARSVSPSARPMSQGRNPWSDIGSLEALSLCGRFFERAVRDASDHEAREAMSWAATLAGVAFGNAGVHLPHGMSYAVAGLVRDFRMNGYPSDSPLVPHGVSVVLGAPAAFAFTAQASPERHLEAAEKLGADVRGAIVDDAGEILAAKLVALMRSVQIPNGMSGVGYESADVDALAERAALQERLLANAPRNVDRATLGTIFQKAMRYW